MIMLTVFCDLAPVNSLTMPNYRITVMPSPGTFQPGGFDGGLLNKVSQAFYLADFVCELLFAFLFCGGRFGNCCFGASRLIGLVQFNRFTGAAHSQI